MKSLIALLLAGLGLAAVSPAQMIPEPPGGYESYNGPCPNRAAIVDVPSVLIPSPVTLTCSNGVPCGYVVYYTPPVTSCVPNVDTKCLVRFERSYAQAFSCAPNGQCKGNTPVYIGFSQLVLFTASCAPVAW